MPTAGSPLIKLLLAVTIAAVLVVDAVTVAARNTDGGTSTVAADAPATSDLKAVLPELIAFVEQTRGLTFIRPPKVDLLSDAAFEKLLLEEDPDDEPAADELDDETFLGVMRALGLVDGDVDLDSVVDDEIDNVLGFYDHRAKVLYARGTKPTPFVKLVLVHELTHALDDQHFGLDRRDLDEEASMAFTALVEGDAGWVEQKWYLSRPREEQDAIEAEESSGRLDGADAEPSVFERLFSFPYAVGPDFVDALRGAGGQARLDAAFPKPPVTTEQVIHPERFLAGEGIRPVAEPQADGRALERGVIGEAFLFLVLDSAVDRSVAEKAAEGWGGDRYVVWRSGNRVCVRFNIVTDTARDMTELVSALRSWAAAHPGASLRGSDPVVVTNCA